LIHEWIGRGWFQSYQKEEALLFVDPTKESANRSIVEFSGYV